MGLQQSKGELLYQEVNNGNIERIKSLHSEGAGLEWVDKDGKTPLISACMNPGLYNVAKTLIELGANVNAYRPRRFGGTPLHHAARRGLEQTVLLLLSHGANALVMNDDSQTPLDIARIKGYSNVVRAIESHICLFSGWLRELYGPGFLELFAPQLLSRRVWVVVVPCGTRNPSKPIRLELAIYASTQDPKPRTIIALWMANLEEPNFSYPDPTVIISSVSNIPRRWRRRRGITCSPEESCRPCGFRQSTRLKLAPANGSDKQQLQLFCNALKGITQARQQGFPLNSQTPTATPVAPPTAKEDEELAMAIAASLLSAHPNPIQNASTSGTLSTGIVKHSFDNSVDLKLQESGPSGGPAQHVVHTTNPTPPDTVPSAPHIEDAIMDDGPIHYPPIDFSSSNGVTVPTIDGTEEKTGDKGGAGSSCVICLDAPVEGACIPCGHMAGCMSCLNEIKGKKWGCPVCRANIQQVVRLYAV